jgi:lipopolysaccharide export system protein LptA
VKRLIQLIIILIIILSFYLIFKNYLIIDEDEKVVKNNLHNLNNFEEITKKDNDENLIKNLEYEINLDQNQKYILTAEKSNVSNLDGTEIIYMENVKAIFFDENDNEMIITSDTGMFNGTSYDSEFSNNVKINYDNHEITAEKMNLNFSKKIINIYENVLYFNADLSLVADIVSINLITKKTDIYMNNNKKKVLINAN